MTAMDTERTESLVRAQLRRDRVLHAAQDAPGLQHLVFNHWDEGAGRETNFVTVAAADGRLSLRGGRWVDRFEVRDGECRIAERETVVDWSATAPGAWTGAPPLAPAVPSRPSLAEVLAVEAVEDGLAGQSLIADHLDAPRPPLAVYVANVSATVEGAAGAAEASFLAVHQAGADRSVEMRGGRCALMLGRRVGGWTIVASEVSTAWVAGIPAPFLDDFVARTRRSAPSPAALGDTRSNDAVELYERQAIRDCLARYAHGADRRDRALVRSAFAGPPPSAVEAIFTQAAQRPVQNHSFTNLRIALHGNEALAEARYLTVIGYAPGAGHGLAGGTPADHDVNLVGGRYVLRLRRTGDGRWVMGDRGNIGDWHAVVDGSTPGIMRTQAEWAHEDGGHE